MVFIRPRVWQRRTRPGAHLRKRWVLRELKAIRDACCVGKLQLQRGVSLRISNTAVGEEGTVVSGGGTGVENVQQKLGEDAC